MAAKNIVIIGDSWAVDAPGTWANQLTAALPTQCYNVKNYAFGGTGWNHWSHTSFNSQDKTKFNRDTDLVIVCCGLNDITKGIPPFVLADAAHKLSEESYGTYYMLCRYGIPVETFPNTPYPWVEELQTYNNHLTATFGNPSQSYFNLGFDGEQLLPRDAIHFSGIHPTQIGHNILAADMILRVKNLYS